MFIDPTTDFAFKKIFGSEDSVPILISFLNGILYGGESAIADLKIVNPYSEPRHVGLKTSCLDVKALLVTGERVLIEMQVIGIEGFEKRILYNAAKEYVNQLSRGEEYRKTQPVVALTITDFTIFNDEKLKNKVISFFHLIEKDELVFYPDGDIELVFVELPKFEMEEGELSSLTEKWLYFLKKAGSLAVVPKVLKGDKNIMAAFDKAEEARLTPDEADALQKHQFFINDQKFLAAQVNSERAEKEKARSDKKAAEIEKARALAEKKKAVSDRKIAEAEKAKAEAEKERLYQLLKKHGINPDD